MRESRLILPLIVAGLLTSVTSANPPGPPPEHPAFSEPLIVLLVADLEQSVSFYRDVLDFEFDYYLVGAATQVRILRPEDPRPYGAGFLAGTQPIALVTEGGSPNLPAKGARYAFVVSDPASYFEHLTKHQIPLRDVVNDGGRPFMFTLSDPDGHEFHFRGPLPAPRSSEPSVQSEPPPQS